MPNTNLKVAVLGGGIGGLTVAHELIERGFQVEVYERNDTCGGKARSLEKPGTSDGVLPNLPGEHGFRFFPEFYQHLDDTMQRIPVGVDNAYDNLVDAQTLVTAQEGKPLYVLPVHRPETLGEWVQALDDVFSNPSLGLASGEKEALLERLFRIFSMCRERREQEYECTTWYDYHNIPNPRSAQYNKMCVTGFSRAFVAMDAEVASTMTGANILAQFFRVFFRTGLTMDRVLNAPTNDAWLTPWVDYLQSQGVVFQMNRTLKGLSVSTAGGTPKITSATIEDSGGVQTNVNADYYVAAFPLEIMQKLLQSHPALLAAAPSLGSIHNLKTSWMTGIMFYLSNDMPINHGHINFADSNWALTGISQPQFWTQSLQSYGDGSLAGLLSIVISDWETNGDKQVLKPANQCTTEQEVAQETWAQIEPHLPASVKASLTPEDPVDFFLDPAITFTGSGAQNDEPLLINTACSRASRPEAATPITNLMLASDYVKTNVDLATMEGANEAGRRAANAVLDASGSTLSRSGVWEYQEPAVFAVPQAIDKALLEVGGPYWGDLLLP